jgi:hypothetical protein
VEGFRNGNGRLRRSKLPLRASLRAAGVRNDIDEGVILTTFAQWRVEFMQRTKIPSDARTLDVLLVRLRPRSSSPLIRGAGQLICGGVRRLLAGRSVPVHAITQLQERHVRAFSPPSCRIVMQPDRRLAAAARSAGRGRC